MGCKDVRVSTANSGRRLATTIRKRRKLNMSENYSTDTFLDFSHYMAHFYTKYLLLKKIGPVEIQV